MENERHDWFVTINLPDDEYCTDMNNMTANEVVKSVRERFPNATSLVMTVSLQD